MRQDGFIVIGRDILARLPEVGCTAMGVYLVLASHADENGECYPSHETIARAVGVTDRSVRTALGELSKAGLVGRKNRRRDTSIYTIQARKQASGQEPSPEKNDAKPGKKRPLSPEASFRQNENHRTITKNEGQDRKPASGQGFDPLAVDLPFDSGPFRQSWGDFCQGRQSSKHPLNEAATTRILAKLERWGEPKAVEALDTAIENGWRGVFEPKGNGKPTGERKCRVPTDEELAGWSPSGGNGRGD